MSNPVLPDFVVVPAEATEEMLLAAQGVVLTDYSFAPGTNMDKMRELDVHIEHINECSAADIYEAMRVAAPGLYDMTVDQLMALRGQIDMRLQFIVCGDPSEGITIQNTKP